MRLKYQDIRIEPLQWIIGAYCVICGAMTLIVPHQFNMALQAPIEPYFPWIGSALLCGGVALLAAAARVLSRPLAIAAHLLAGAALAQVALAAVMSGAWSGFTSLMPLGLAAAIAAVLPRGQADGRPALDLFALAMSAAVIATGAVFCLPLAQFAAAAYDPVRPYLAWYGVAFISSGLLLAAADPLRLPHAWRIVAHLAAAGALFAWTAGLGLPNWNSLLYNLGLGGAIALLPWLGPGIARFDPTRLRARVALALAGGVALPLIVAVAVIAQQDERAYTEQALAHQRALAAALAEETAASIGLHRAAAVALADTPGLAGMPPEQQRALLERLGQVYPDITLFATYDAAGSAVARSNGHAPATSIAGLPVYEQARRMNAPSLDLSAQLVPGRMLIVIGAPLRDPQGQFAGLAAAGIAPEQIFAQIARGAGVMRASAYLVDAQGRIIAHPDPAQITADGSPAPPVAALRASEAGVLRYIDQAGVQLAAYAPVRDLGWAVVVERPAAIALSDVYARRDRDFGVLLLATMGLLIIGRRVAHGLVQPLTLLARAAGGLATGDNRAPLPSSKIAEVSRLAGAFGEMRERLSARTTERDDAEARLQLLAEAGSGLAESLDYATTLDTIARLMVGGLADYCVIDLTDEHGAIRRAAIAHADPAREDLAHQLGNFPPDRGGDSRIARALRTGVPDLMPAVSDAALATLARSPDHLDLLRALDITSLMTVPLIARGRAFGVISLARTSASARYTAADLLLADELARRAALALENARLYGEAQAAVGLRDQFLSVASHELKTPLTVLLGNVQLLQRRVSRDGGMPERERHTLALIAEQAARLNRMIAVLLDISRIQGGQLTVERQPVDMRSLTQRVIAELQPALDQHTIVYEDAGEPLVVAGDELRLDQVLQNLIGNAAKYSPHGGVIAVRVERRDQQVCVVVADEGIGIPREAQQHLFRRFYRAPNVDPQRITGMGIGLYVVSEIVALHGGSVTVESEVGAGSTFTVSLPLLARAEEVGISR